MATRIRPNKPNSGLFGTMEYCAPEVLENRPASTKIDVWSLGVVIFEALLGRLRWMSYNPQATDQERAQRSLEGFRHLRDHEFDVSRALNFPTSEMMQRLLIREMLVYDPYKRSTASSILAINTLSIYHTLSHPSVKRQLYDPADNPLFPPSMNPRQTQQKVVELTTEKNRVCLSLLIF